MATARGYQPIVPHAATVYVRGTVSIAEKATQTFKRGAPLIYNGGYVEEAGSAPSTVTFIAAEDGHNGASDGTYNVICWPIIAGDLYYVSLLDAIAQAQLGANYGLVKDATTKFWYLSTADTGDQMTVKTFEGGPGGAEIGDTKSRVLATFDAANIAGAGE